MPLPKNVRIVAVVASVAIAAGSVAALLAAHDGKPAREAVPHSPAGDQVAWILDQTNAADEPLLERDVEARFHPDYLSGVARPEQVVQLLREVAREHGPLSVLAFEQLRNPSVVMATLRTRSGTRAALRLEVEPAPPSRIVNLELGDPPRRVVATGRYSGRYDIGARRVFLHCTGSGTPTVILEGGTTADWVPVQNRLSRDTRVCSYDRANAPWARSDRAPTPRAAADVVADLHAVLAAARVPGPYVLAGHSNGGLFVQLYARTHPDDVAGLVLIDSVHVDYTDRRLALIERLGGGGPPRPEYMDPEQKLLLDRTISQVRDAALRRPLPDVPLEVLVHGEPAPEQFAPGTPEHADAELWLDLQRELAALVPAGRMTVVAGTGHDIPAERPQVVIDAVRRVLPKRPAERANSGEHQAHPRDKDGTRD